MSEGALLELRERTKTKNDELKRASRVLEFLLEGENGGRERTADARVGILGGQISTVGLGKRVSIEGNALGRRRPESF